MKQQDFENQYSEVWDKLAKLLESKPFIDAEIELPGLYKQVSHHLSLAKSRRYTLSLITNLNYLVTECHHHYYQGSALYRYQFMRFIFIEFPAALRRNKYFVFASLAIFILPALIMFGLCLKNPDMIYTIMEPSQVSDFENMYEPNAKKIGRERDSDTDISMFGFYIKHNISIAFQTFAGGLIFGIGAIFYLLFNGLLLGGVTGHIAQIEYGSTFFPFVIGHGAFELTAIVYSGAAGLRIGFALIAPGRYRRMDALKLATKDAVVIVYGAILMLVIAAFLEAFWSSSSTLTPMIKYSVGAIFWLIVISYSCLMGRGLSQNEHQ
ncbi:MAG: stage II sporulation protein M [Gammaproteobacteria bacterium]|nr:MAG: stage II sporulation protein M [Gammaproteobacteria bacterium]